MAWKKKKAAKASVVPQIMPSLPLLPPGGAQLFLGYDPTGKMVQRRIVSSKEGWSEFKLDDGSVITAKAVILDAKHAVGQFNNNGDPIYVLQMTMVQNLRAPKSLRKKSKK